MIRDCRGSASEFHNVNNTASEADLSDLTQIALRLFAVVASYLRKASGEELLPKAVRHKFLNGPRCGVNARIAGSVGKRQMISLTWKVREILRRSKI